MLPQLRCTILEKEAWIGLLIPSVDSDFGYMESHSFLRRISIPGFLFLTELDREVSKAKQKKTSSNIKRKVISGRSVD